MQKPNCKCLACGKEYYFCLACNKHRSTQAPAWHIDFCDETCKTVFEAISDYNCGSLTKEQVADKIKDCDLSRNFKDSLKEKIKEVQKSAKANKPSFSESYKNEKKEDSSKGYIKPNKEDKGEE